ncbi:hydroxyacylglutathione hydrolase [Clostridium tepidiprofundi DSM 19306]|uniref:Hydroxyacylglutathione hydrolase n=1 Tax=Clostridium tepidiprofundi DSM 19306 TaxID=1121338 RepID=A0A151B7F1_9CLOT|nr:MBL fold metallo-hydrolase [Clostridium tepidiprofundi]KYH35814.1 hydroxyacylglutathione hydrolase [Clostridium tepidiprofundi DSM 19306]
MKEQQKFYNKAWFMWLTLIFFPPIGIFLMWKNKRYNKVVRSVLSIIFGLLFMAAIVGGNSDTNETLKQNKQVAVSKTVELSKDKKTENIATESENINKQEDTKKEDAISEKTKENDQQAAYSETNITETKKETEKIEDIKKETDTKAENIGELKVHFIDVGQADSILVEQNKHFMLIDAGNNADSTLVVNYLKQHGVSKLDYVIGTHPHEDHIGGLDAVINTFDIGKVLMPKKVSTTKTYRDVILAIKNKGLKITVPVPGATYKLGAAEWTILAPGKDEDYEKTNNYSIVQKLRFGNTSFIFTGDAEDVSEREILARKYDLKADVLKIGHHGSKTSTTKEFLAAVDPKYAVISCGKDNDYGHPNKETMDKLKNNRIIVYRTDECGTIVCTSNGKDISFDTKAGDYTYRDGETIIEGDKNNTSKTNTVQTSKENNKIIIQSIDKVAEIVVIKNTSDKDIDLTGWKLVSVTGNQTYIFPKYVLKAGASIKISSGNSRGDLKWSKRNIWNNSKEDDGELYDNLGNLIYHYDN